MLFPAGKNWMNCLSWDIGLLLARRIMSSMCSANFLSTWSYLHLYRPWAKAVQQPCRMWWRLPVAVSHRLQLFSLPYQHARWESWFRWGNSLTWGIFPGYSILLTSIECPPTESTGHVGIGQRPWQRACLPLYLSPHWPPGVSSLWGMPFTHLITNLITFHKHTSKG